MTVVRWLSRLHDGLSDAGYVVGTVGLFALVSIYCYEVVTRYFFGLATDWANDTFSNVLCVTIFSMVPHVTRAGMHIAITLVQESRPQLDRLLKLLTGALGFVICLFVAWMSLEANIRQIALQIVTEQNRPLPKVYMSGFITYAFLSASFYFLRSLSRASSVQPMSWVASAGDKPAADKRV